MKKLFILIFIAIGTIGSAQVVATKKCRVYTMTGNFSGTTTVTVQEASALTDLTVKNECTDGLTYTVSSFDFTAAMDGKAPYALKGTSSKLTEEMKANISRTKSGMKYYFDNVSAKGSDGQVKTLPGITLVIK